MLQEIEDLIELNKKLAEKLKVWVVDKSIDINVRWDAFIKSDLGEHKSYYEDFVNFNTDDYCDNIDKYQVIKLSDATNFKCFSNEEYDEFREDVLSKFIKSFEFDW